MTKYPRRKKRSNHWQSSSDASERIRKACEKFNLKFVFTSDPTLRSLLTRLKYHLPKETLAGVLFLPVW